MRFFLSLFLSLSLVVLTTAAAPKNPQVDKALRTLFDKWDLDHDNYLDRDELAKHFRGPKAVSPEGGAYDEKGNISPLYYQARRKYPELIFLWSLDTDMDDRVGWPEFEKYGQEYAVALKKRVQAERRLLQQIYRRANRNMRMIQQQRMNYIRNMRRAYGRPHRHYHSRRRRR